MSHYSLKYVGKLFKNLAFNLSGICIKESNLKKTLDLVQGLINFHGHR